ncbi:mitochondrial enolase superfamily member 1 [Grus japonensis]|uniref:Mitochondrial enolase superfamily member 1 n=1 Tax=Grus japonensis TaxID=30415 RepID=A0ABC9WCP0_GRUJA
MKLNWRPVTGGVPQALKMGAILFSILINDLDNGTEYILSKLTDDTNLEGVADTPGGCAAIQKDLERLERSAKRNLMQFNKGK